MKSLGWGKMGKENLSIGLKTLKTSYPTKTEKEFDFLHPFSVTWDENTVFFPTITSILL